MLWIWAGFVAFVLLMLALDLGVFHRKAHVVGVREALGWSAVWIALALAFAVFVYHGYEHQWMGLGTRPTRSTAARSTPRAGQRRPQRRRQVPDRLRRREVALASTTSS